MFFKNVRSSLSNIFLRVNFLRMSTLNINSLDSCLLSGFFFVCFFLFRLVVFIGHSLPSKSTVTEPLTCYLKNRLLFEELTSSA